MIRKILITESTSHAPLHELIADYPGNVIWISSDSLPAGSNKRGFEDMISDLINKESHKDMLIIFDHMFSITPNILSLILTYPNACPADIIFKESSTDVFGSSSGNLFFPSRPEKNSWDIIRDTDKIIITGYGFGLASNLTDFRYLIAWRELFQEFLARDTPSSDGELMQRIARCRYNQNERDVRTLSHRKDLEEWFLRLSHEFIFPGCQDNYRQFENLYKKALHSLAVPPYTVSENSRTHITHKHSCNIKQGLAVNLTLLDIAELDAYMDLSKYDYVWLSCETGCLNNDPALLRQIKHDTLFPEWETFPLNTVPDNPVYFYTGTNS